MYIFTLQASKNPSNDNIWRRMSVFFLVLVDCVQLDFLGVNVRLVPPQRNLVPQ